MILEKIRFGRSQEAHHANPHGPYFADETKLKELGLTRMDVIRLLKTKLGSAARCFRIHGFTVTTGD